MIACGNINAPPPEEVCHNCYACNMVRASHGEIKQNLYKKLNKINFYINFIYNFAKFLGRKAD